MSTTANYKLNLQTNLDALHELRAILIAQPVSLLKSTALNASDDINRPTLQYL